MFSAVNRKYELALKRVKRNGLALKNIKKKDQTEEMCLMAVRQNEEALQYVKNQTEEMCLVAVSKNAWAFRHVKEQTEAICLSAVKQRGDALQLVENQTEEMCLIAVRSQNKDICVRSSEDVYNIIWNPNLEYVKNQTKEICLEAVKVDRYTLLHVRDQTEEICVAAAKRDYRALHYVRDQTPEICLAAIEDFWIDGPKLRQASNLIRDLEMREQLVTYVMNRRFMKTKSAKK